MYRWAESPKWPSDRLGPEAAQSQRVADDAEAGASHRARGKNGVEQPDGSERERGEVVAERPAEVLLDRSQRRAGEADGAAGGARSPLTRVRSEASIATSVPVPIERRPPSTPSGRRAADPKSRDT